MDLTIEEIVRATNAIILKNEIKDTTEIDISTDTRSIHNKDIYLPLKGENFDGEKFITNELSDMCLGYFTTKDIVMDNASVVFKVKNTLNTYINIAKIYKKKVSPITICVTGSSGKTTTKELIYSVLSQKYKVHKTLSNHNNEIGFCQTLLSMDKDTEILIVEAGMRGFSEIELISKNLEPNYGVITNSGSAHVGRLGSLENIAKAKCEIIAGMTESSTLIAKDQEIIKNNLKFNGNKIFYSIEDVKIIKKDINYIEFIYNNFTYKLNVTGEYNVENSLAAINLGYQLGLTNKQIYDGLLAYKPIEKRNELITIMNLHFINDSYNANPESMKSSVKTFIELYDNPVVVLGDMGELGDSSIDLHKEVGKYLLQVKNNIKYIIIGNFAKYIGEMLEQDNNVTYFNTNEEAANYILNNCNESDNIFLKASRSMKFEEIIEYIKRRG